MPINNDDDDYSIGDFSVRKNNGEDLQQNDKKGKALKVTGEDDLLPIVLRRSSVGGQYILRFPKDQFALYKSSDRSEPLAASQPFDVPRNQDLTLYVEGKVVGPGVIYLDWTDGAKQRPRIRRDVDDIRVTVFNWVGPLNVPEHSIQRYVANGAPAGAKWLDPANNTGTIDSGKDSDVKIKWADGPIVGRAVYQVNDKYMWDLEVNVVQVKVDAPPDGKGPAFDAGDVYDGGLSDHTGNTVWKGVHSSDLLQLVDSDGRNKVPNGKPGLTWQAHVTMSGPTANGVDQRGVRQIRAGFIQNVTPVKDRATFGLANDARSQFVGVSSLERPKGPPIWDTINPPTGAWYDFAPPSLVQSEPDATKGLNREKILASADSPAGGPPRRESGKPVLSMQMVWDFQLYVAAQTSDNRNGANKIYTAAAEADWSLDGSGTFQTQADGSLLWTRAAAAGITPPKAWGAVVQAPVVDAPRANDLIRNVRWTKL